MGCNTSQELKTKDAINTNATNGVEQNEENVVTEQNATNEVEQPTIQKSLSKTIIQPTTNAVTPEEKSIQKSMGLPTSVSNQSHHITNTNTNNTTPTTTTATATNHSKTNSIVSNGDAMLAINRQSTTANSLKTLNSNTSSNSNTNINTTNSQHHSCYALPAKENGAVPSAVNGISVDDDDNGGDNKHVMHDVVRVGDGGNSTSLSKMEMVELNGLEMGEDEEEKAATKIQAVFRGHQVRNTMKKVETKTTTTTNNMGSAANNVAAAAATVSDPTKAELEAEFNPNDKELCDAARKIQATFRGHLTRKLVNKEGDDDDDDVDIQEITMKVAEELDIDLNDPELHKAATKIQASFRGHKIRKDIE